MSAPHLSVVGLSTIARPTPTPTLTFHIPVISTLHISDTYNGTLLVSTATLTVDYRTITILPPSQTHFATSSSSTTNKGAIAGGVLGGLAVLIAALAAVFCLRRRSPRRWRNRRQGARWTSLDDIKPNRQVSPSLSHPHVPPHADNPFASEDKKHVASHPHIETMPAFIVHDNHNQPSDPFADPPASHTSHNHNNSSFGNPSYHQMDGLDHIELGPNAASSAV